MSNREKGNYFENLAKDYLINQGFLILEKNYYSNYGEIDIICRKESTIIFVEVKYRSNNNYGYPRETVNKRKQNKIIKTSLIYIEEKNLTNFNFRYDVLEFFNGKIEHIENAFWFGE